MTEQKAHLITTIVSKSLADKPILARGRKYHAPFRFSRSG